MKTARLIALAIAFFSPLRGGEDAVREAVTKGLAVATGAAERFARQKTCFACHHDTLPLLAAAEARRAGFSIPAEWMKTVADHTRLYFEKRADDLVAGDHLPGGAASAGYGLWALELADHAPDASAEAIVDYVLQIQGVKKKAETPPAAPLDGRWLASCLRPPIQSGEIGDTVQVLIGLERFAGGSQRARAAAARARAEIFLAQAKPANHPERLWHFWGLHRLGGDDKAKNTARDAILTAQRDDGSWAQESGDAAGDAYATGQTLHMLLAAGEARPDDAAMRQARDFLLKTQQPDGSWLVKSRVTKKVQPPFDNGDPHGDDQWVSVSATCWAVAGLARLLP